MVKAALSLEYEYACAKLLSRPRFDIARARDLEHIQVRDLFRCVTRYVANNSLKGAAVDFGTDHRRRLSTCYVTRDDEECNSPKRPPAAAGYF